MYPTDPAAEGRDTAPGMTPGEMLRALRGRLHLLLLGALAAGGLAFGVATLIPPTYTAVATFLPPQQAQSSASALLSALGPLAGLAGSSSGVGSSNDRYIALMQSVTVADRLVDKFQLLTVYDAKFRVDARKELAQNTRISGGKKDGLITVEVDDRTPQRAADLANQFIEELRRVTSTLAVTEAQQRRVFFEQQLGQVRQRLVTAQNALQASGFNAGALKAEPKAEAEAFARLRAEVTAGEVALQTLRGSFTDDTREVRQQQARLAALRAQLSRTAQSDPTGNGPDYIGKYREFKYQETLFDLYARQFELARADEGREGALIQVVDPATPPEKKSKPKRAFIAAAAGLLSLVLLAILVLTRAYAAQTLPAAGSRRAASSSAAG